MILRGYFPSRRRLLGTLDDVDAEEIESLLLDGGWYGMQDEFVVVAGSHCKRVSGERCEVGEQALEAVDGKTVGSRAELCLASADGER